MKPGDLKQKMPEIFEKKSIFLERIVDYTNSVSRISSLNRY